MKKVSNNVIKVIAISTVTMLIALTLELLMYHQHGTSLVSSTVLWRAGLIVALSVVVDFLAALDWRFDGYVTVLVMLYYAAADWGAFEVVRPKASVYGMFVQVLAILGILLCIAGIWYGIKQRHYYSIQEINKMGR